MEDSEIIIEEPHEERPKKTKVMFNNSNLVRQLMTVPKQVRVEENLNLRQIVSTNAAHEEDTREKIGKEGSAFG